MSLSVNKVMNSVSNETMNQMSYLCENKTKILVVIKQVEERVNREHSKPISFAKYFVGCYLTFTSLFDTVSVNQSNETVIHHRVSRWISVSCKESFIW